MLLQETARVTAVTVHTVMTVDREHGKGSIRKYKEEPDLDSCM